MANKIKTKVYNWSIKKTLHFYENYMLPVDKNRPSLVSTKL